ncbi:response regulator [Leptospirillum ferriphilum]|uniref:response regulator n=1 Tax=Leptospirillum ferriphilum TaxID=178606 RepID=UPI0006B1BC3B|nr:response regulator [Leptospirillum ferriphilum]
MNMPFVLVVDDYANTRAYLRALLEHEGFGVLEAGTGERALEILSSKDGRSVRAILLDLKLPNQSGIDLIAPFRSLCPRAPIIIMTAHASVPTAVSAIQKGAFHYLENPLPKRSFWKPFPGRCPSRHRRGKAKRVPRPRWNSWVPRWNG